MKLFIVIEGIDGSGKTTLALMLKKYLESEGKQVFYTSEPSDSEYGKEIETLLRKKHSSSVTKEKWLELFTLDRKENMKNIKTALDEEKVVISDRYYYSTLAYQLDEQEWQNYALQFIVPNIVFILDCPVDIALERVKQKYSMTGEKKAFFEKSGILRKVRKKFLLLPNYLKDNIKIVNTERQVDEIFEYLKKEIDEIISRA